MSDDRSPLASLFRTQHQLIENGQQFIEQTMRVPLEMNETLRDSLDQQRALQRETLELSHDAVIAVLDSANATTSGEQMSEVRTAVDEGFESLLKSHDQLSDELDEGYADATSGLEDAMEGLTAQTAALVELNEEFEHHAVTAFERSTGEVQETLMTQFGELDEEIEEPSTAEERERVEKQREQVETVRERIETLQAELEKGIEQAKKNAEQQADEQTGNLPESEQKSNHSGNEEKSNHSESEQQSNHPGSTDESDDSVKK